ncbi:hypothetical protein QYE76_044642 [Lolium multiflorum]|uniref:DUF6598 domain-containing protein n=1 Tax=Lolium multiflorum TaxID=4521 RepID=A0AAD8WX96_LOLMU|nr:hypothetical protein QYE76_044642 [Lolium multiflorum]
MPTLQVYAMKVTQISHPLQWPLHIYGVVAVRDYKDSKRNFLFRRDRDNFQTLNSPKDSLLELTGPSRAVVLRGPRAFEIDLKVKGNGTPSEDEALCYNAFIYNNLADYGKYGQARTVVVPSKHNTIEARLAHLKDTVEATITIYVMEKQAFCALFTAHTKSIDDRMVLLDSRDCEVAVDETVHTRGMAGYAEGFLSGPLAYGLARAPPEDDRRRTDAVGVEVATPRAALGIYRALGVASTSPPLAPAPSPPAHGVTIWSGLCRGGCPRRRPCAWRATTCPCMHMQMPRGLPSTYHAQLAAPRCLFSCRNSALCRGPGRWRLRPSVNGDGATARCAEGMYTEGFTWPSA